MSRKLVFLLLMFAVAAPWAATAQVRPSNDYGALGLGQLYKRMQVTGSVMMIGAHPDDEDSALLAYLARGRYARTAYLSLTRGDGGQNIIGPELFEPLGVIRTEELAQARRLDGAEQYFTRAFDYGFSKTLDEAKARWPEEEIKCDAVRAIRHFRPVVVISRFSGTPRDGHGQHQYAGYITPKAVAASADWGQCWGAGDPWRVRKLYVEQGFGENQPEPTLRINTGAYDPILGRTYFEIAMEGRSLHRSQGEGRIEFHGDIFSGLDRTGAAPGVREKDIFDGVDVTVAGIPSLTQNSEANFNAKTTELAAAVAEAVSSADLFEPSKNLDRLARVYSLANEAEWSTRVPDSKFRMREIQDEAAAAIRIAAGIQIDALADRETVVPGGELLVSVKAFSKSEGVNFGEISLSAPSKWTVAKADAPKQNNAAFNTREVAARGGVFSIRVSPDAEPTEPYWLRSERSMDLFIWPEAIKSATLPFEPDDLVAKVPVTIGKTEIVLEQPVQFRFSDPARGEIRRTVDVVPAMSLAVDHSLIVVPTSSKPETRRVTLSVTSHAPSAVNGTASVDVPAEGWQAAFRKKDVALASRGDRATLEFDITVPAATRPGTYALHPSVAAGGSTAASTMSTIAYPHIQTHRIYGRTETRVLVVDMKAPTGSVGYVMGSGDDVPEAIRQMGPSVSLLEEKDLASGDLGRFRTIVIGIRASETRPDLIANKARLMEYVEKGGNLIVQYQRNNFVQSGLAPFPIDTTDKQRTAAGSIARVVDETAPVTILSPDHPALNTPNKITASDFDGWVQERNAYNLVTFDTKYTPLLESHDVGEQPNNGGLVVAKVGKGNWVYCSYSLFRQLPAGVPGAYRLLANLLALEPAR